MFPIILLFMRLQDFNTLLEARYVLKEEQTMGLNIRSERENKPFIKYLDFSIRGGT
jgi:hypothetical protein